MAEQERGEIGARARNHAAVSVEPARIRVGEIEDPGSGLTPELAALVLAIVDPELERLRASDPGEMSRVLEVREREEPLVVAALAYAREAWVAANVESWHRVRPHARESDRGSQVLIEIEALDMVAIAEKASGRGHEERRREQLRVGQQDVLLALRPTDRVGVGRTPIR